MTHDQQSTGRTRRWFRGGLRAAAVGSALCLAAGMGLSMATQASAAPRPLPGRHGGVLPVCISFGGILRLALPLPTCNGPVVLLEIAGHHDHPGPSGIDTYVSVAQSSSTTSPFQATATCDRHPGDVATGGGFATSGLLGYLLNTDAPVTGNGVSSDGDTPDGWTAGITFATDQVGSGSSPTFTVYAVCTDGPGFLGGGGSSGFGSTGTGLGAGLSAPAHHAAARHH